MTDIMIDLETLGIAPGCPVLSIGAVRFDIEKGWMEDKVFAYYKVLNITEQIDKGFKANGNTLKWWMQQNESAKEVFFGESMAVEEALIGFSAYAMDLGTPTVWGNGSTFDISILEEMYRRYDLVVPWTFWNVMDLRTFKRFKAPTHRVKNSGIKHNALDDAIAQAQFVLDYS